MGTIVVTGAGGYLGAHVLAALRRAGHGSVGLARREAPGLAVCDLLDAPRLARLMKKLQPARILHCAWETPRTLSQYDDCAAAERGLAMLDNLLAATQAPILLVSSMTVYGQDNATPTRREGDAGQPESAYGRAKWAAEQRLAASGRAGFAARLPGLFGGGRQCGLVWCLLRALLSGNPPELPRRPLLWAAMDVRDAAHSLAHLCDAPCEQLTPVNIGYQDVYSISRLVTLLGDLTGHATTCDVPHPDFAFDLARVRALGAAPEQTLRGACLRLLEEVA